LETGTHAAGQEVTIMKKLTLKKLEKRIAPRYMPF